MARPEESGDLTAAQRALDDLRTELDRHGASVELPLVQALDDGSYLALLYAPGLHAAARRRLLAAARCGEAMDEDRARLVRVVEYTVPDRNPGGELIALATDLLDPALLPAAELAWAYHQRWEHETVLAEMKPQCVASWCGPSCCSAALLPHLLPPLLPLPSDRSDLKSGLSGYVLL